MVVDYINSYQTHKWTLLTKFRFANVKIGGMCVTPLQVSKHGSPTRGRRAAFGPPACIVRLAATFVNCVCTKKNSTVP